MKYGSKYRKIRKDKNITLEKACDGITSRSSLSRWENGEDNLSYNIVLDLLKKLDLQAIEFFEEKNCLEVKSEVNQIIKFYFNREAEKIYEKFEDAKELENNGLKEKYFFLKMVAANYYKGLKEIDLATEREKNRVTNFFYNVSHWSLKELFYFENVVGIFKPKDLYKLASAIMLVSSSYDGKTEKWYEACINTLVNSIYILIKEDIKLALKLLKKMRENFDKFSMELEAKLKFEEELIKYILVGDKSGIEKILAFLELSNMRKIEKRAKYALQQIEDRYEIK